ncbi:hypothetical protein ACLMAB_26760 [Brevibacillus laterosporus]
MEELLGKFCEEYSFVDAEWKEENGRKLLYTDRGLHYIHTCPPSYRAKSLLVEKTIEAIHKNCDLKVLPICKANDDNYHVKDGEVLYYLQEGMRETTWERHYFNLGKSLAEFHQATRSLSWDKLYLPYRSLGTWPEMWGKSVKPMRVYSIVWKNRIHLTLLRFIYLRCLRIYRYLQRPLLII